MCVKLALLCPFVVFGAIKPQLQLQLVYWIASHAVKVGQLWVGGASPS